MVCVNNKNLVTNTKIMLFSCVLVTLLGIGTAQIIAPGKCDPKLEVVDKFDIGKYSGLWYEMAWLEESPPYIGDCVKVTYALDDSLLTVTTKLLSAGVPETYISTAKMDPESQGSGKLLVKPLSSNKTSPYWVLATDYTTYALAYGCINLSENRKQVSSWIFSRTPTLTPQSVLAMNNKVQTIDVLDWDAYLYTNHTESACRPKDTTTASTACG